jgi:hypothetical protein
MATTNNPFTLVLSGYIQDLQSGIEYLRRELTPAQQYSAARSMCELSRDITFSLGPPSEYDCDYVEWLAELLTRAAEAIDPRDSDEISAFRTHILARVKLLRDEYAQAQHQAAGADG